MNTKTLTVSLLIVALLVAALALRNGAVAWLALPFLCYLGAGIWQSPARETVRLETERQVRRARDGDAPLIEVCVTVRNLGASIDRLNLYDVPPEGIKIIEGRAYRQAALPAGAELQLKYAFRERRGSYAWKTVRAVASDPFGLVEAEYLLPARAEIEIQPERGPLRRLPLHPPGTLHSPGSIPARIGGTGTDFWGVREYHPGDSLRWLDWRLTARHPRKFFTKEFEQEEIADIGLILDAREKTDLRREEDSLFEHSVSATATLAEAFLHQGHRVSMLVAGSQLDAVFPGYGKVQLNKMLNCLARTQTGTSRLYDDLDYLPLRMFSSQALLVVFSPLVRNDWPFFLRLRSAGYHGLLVSPNPFDFLSGGTAQDPPARLALQAARLERALELRDIARLHIPVIDWQVSTPLYPLVRDALSRSRLRDARLRSLNKEAA